MSRFEALHTLISENPGDAELRYLLGLEHVNRGDLELALRCFDACLERNADYAYAYFHAAKALQDLGRMEDARRKVLSGVEAARRGRDARAAAELEDLAEELG
ncbi:MAG: tetratricopeptide repeat protein [Planctomycetes bacterium]|nr:tetratricopeptide repeat protein [Planctomycetota bacterium]